MAVLPDYSTNSQQAAEATIGSVEASVPEPAATSFEAALNSILTDSTNIDIHNTILTEFSWPRSVTLSFCKRVERTIVQSETFP